MKMITTNCCVSTGHLRDTRTDAKTVKQCNAFSQKNLHLAGLAASRHTSRHDGRCTRAVLSACVCVVAAVTTGDRRPVVTGRVSQVFSLHCPCSLISRDQREIALHMAK